MRTWPTRPANEADSTFRCRRSRPGWPRFGSAAAALVLVTARTAQAAPAAERVPAVRVEVPPRLDGRLDDEAWRAAPPITAFRQRQPDEGAAASEQTEARIVYDDRAVYVAFRCRDRSPAEIGEHLGRRDDLQASDWVSVSLDTAHDHRTAYFFLVNASGSQRDGIRAEGQEENQDWDGLWDAEVHRDADGWTAEIAIPLSTLRFATADVQTWGVLLERYVNRRKEESSWPLIPLSAAQFVGRFADLEGLRNLRRGLSLQLLPYASGAIQPSFARGSLAPRDPARGQVGLDAKYALTGDLTLDATLNPDFAQVEVDPAVLNLSAFEVFFPEKRAFFLEGADIFQGAGAMVYTRRIGAPPPAPEPRFGGDLIEVDRAARIWGALKLSGSVGPGTSIGLISAYVDATAAVERAADGPYAGDHVVRATPGTTYSLGRVRQALGESALGATVTAVNRLEGEPSAYGFEGDLDLRGKSDYTLAVQGAASLTKACDPARSPDFHGGCDPVGVTVQGGKTGGEVHVAEHLTYHGAEFDPSDLGFLQKLTGNQLVSQNTTLGYYRPRPLGPMALTWLETNFQTSWDPNAASALVPLPMTQFQLGFDGFLKFLNNWELGWSYAHDFGHFDDTETRLNRQVRLFYRPPSEFGLFKVRSNDALPLWAEWLNTVTYERDTWTHDATFELGLRLGGRLSLRANVATQGVHGRPRWVEGAADSAPRFAALQLRQLAMTLRTDFAVTRRFTVQLFSQMLHAVQHYTTTYLLDDPYTLRRCTSATDCPMPSAFDDDLTALIVNAVVRWEFRPGSTVYAVYTHNQQVTAARRGAVSDGQFDLGRAFGTLGNVPADDVIAVKVSYLWSL